MGFNFNNDPFSPAAPGDKSPASLSASPSPSAAEGPAATSPASAAPMPVTSDNPQSAAFVRFGSCRWQQPAEDGNAAFCTHREVKPYAGTTGFDPDAWCPDCQYYKLRRAPKKREPRDDYSY
ncbi:MAG TPA: hypothetical protein VM846_03415 [Vicinamibacterales bacterium]|nr:hypothetical protein [Vicinamibacterales bacterium]